MARILLQFDADLEFVMLSQRRATAPTLTPREEQSEQMRPRRNAAYGNAALSESLRNVGGPAVAATGGKAARIPQSVGQQGADEVTGGEADQHKIVFDTKLPCTSPFGFPVGGGGEPPQKQPSLRRILNLSGVASAGT